jgi:hypothetical protein
MATKSRNQRRTTTIVHTCTQEETLRRHGEVLDRISTVTLGNGHPEDGLLFLFRAFLKDRDEMIKDIKDIKSKVDEAIGASARTRNALDKYKAEMGGVEKGKEKAINEDKLEKEHKHTKTIRVLTTISISIAAIGLTITTIFTVLNHQGQKGLKTEVDMINTPVRTRSGNIEFWPSGVVIDSLKKQQDTISK